MAAHRMGFDCVGSTLSGYTAENTLASHAAPDSDMVRELSAQGVWVIAEGRIASADMAAQALTWGAKAVTVGSALTRLESMVSVYVQGMQTPR
jgi:N-acylglucosamine-6-phosphate 2-epimerase